MFGNILHKRNAYILGLLGKVTNVPNSFQGSLQ